MKRLDRQMTNAAILLGWCAMIVATALLAYLVMTR